jgi:hypothetical protein
MIQIAITHLAVDLGAFIDEPGKSAETVPYQRPLLVRGSFIVRFRLRGRAVFVFFRQAVASFSLGIKLQVLTIPCVTPSIWRAMRWIVLRVAMCLVRTICGCAADALLRMSVNAAGRGHSVPKPYSRRQHPVRTLRAGKVGAPSGEF